ncbi:MAG: hypothetical protein QOF13_1164 [Solirubrobacterales bacterium]|jgi:hypothetical protein|nr:hypothetical protein [Solirubrobacterales bacterium]
MNAVRESWTDARLDDFREDVGRRFDKVDKRFDKVDTELQAVGVRFDSLQRILMQIGFVLAVGLLGVIAALIGVIATQI